MCMHSECSLHPECSLRSECSPTHLISSPTPEKGKPSFFAPGSHCTKTISSSFTGWKDWASAWGDWASTIQVSYVSSHPLGDLHDSGAGERQLWSGLQPSGPLLALATLWFHQGKRGGTGWHWIWLSFTCLPCIWSGGCSKAQTLDIKK